MGLGRRVVKCLLASLFPLTELRWKVGRNDNSNFHRNLQALLAPQVDFREDEQFVRSIAVSHAHEGRGNVLYKRLKRSLMVETFIVVN